MNSAYQPSIHMTDDLQADSLVIPTCFKVHIKCSKTDPFHLGCDIYVGHFLTLHGSSEGPLFTFSERSPSYSATIVIHNSVCLPLNWLYWLLFRP